MHNLSSVARLSDLAQCLQGLSMLLHTEEIPFNFGIIIFENIYTSFFLILFIMAEENLLIIIFLHSNLKLKKLSFILLLFLSECKNLKF